MTTKDDRKRKADREWLARKVERIPDRAMRIWWLGLMREALKKRAKKC